MSGRSQTTSWATSYAWRALSLQTTSRWLSGWRRPSIRCVGYRQVWEALDAGLDLSQAAVLKDMMDKGIAATRQLAKRQVTWLRSMPQRIVVPTDQPGALDAVRRAFMSPPVATPVGE